MRVVLLAVALVLISASLVAFLWGVPANGGARTERSIVSGRVQGDLPGHPWAGTVVSLGTEYVILSEDGEFRFAVMPGRYHLTVCCSQRFQAIDRDIVVEKIDLSLDLKPNPLTEIKGLLTIQGGTQAPYGFLVSASLTGTNVVDRTSTAVDGSFAFHLLAGDWEIRMENLPEAYKIESITLGEEKIRDRRFTLAKGSPSLPLQIALR